MNFSSIMLVLFLMFVLLLLYVIFCLDFVLSILLVNIFVKTLLPRIYCGKNLHFLFPIIVAIQSFFGFLTHWIVRSRECFFWSSNTSNCVSSFSLKRKIMQKGSQLFKQQYKTLKRKAYSLCSKFISSEHFLLRISKVRAFLFRCC